MPERMVDPAGRRFGWYMYDWANSAFAMTVLAALFGPFLDKVVIPEGGAELFFFGARKLSATSIYGYALGFSAMLVLLTAPWLGALADTTATRKRFLAAFCATGSIASALMFFIGPGDVDLAVLLFVIANISFVSSNVFYDSFLPHIAAPQEQDRVSGIGYSYGYAGGGLLFLAQLLLIGFHDALGIADPALAVRISLSSVGFWWGGFALITFAKLEEPAARTQAHLRGNKAAEGLRRVLSTVQKIRRLPNLLLFLVSFMIYNDGIQTVIAMAALYGSEELGFNTMTLMGCLLMVQAVGAAGSRIFASLAGRIGNKESILLSLAVWSLVTCYAFFMTTPAEFWIMGALVGLVLGGSQALSRSLFSSIIPPAASAEFFGFFSVFEKFSAIWGPIAFAMINQFSGNSRMSILSLAAFFITGGLLLLFVDVDRAGKESEAFQRERAADGELAVSDTNP